MVAGAPRTVTPPYDDLIALGKEMVQWFKDHPETLHIQEWYSIEKMILYKDWKAIIVKPEFFPYYEQALAIVGKKYLDKTSNIRDSVSHRFIRHYFKHTKEDEDAEQQERLERELEHKQKLMDHQAKLNQQTVTNVSDDMMKVLESFTNQVSESHSDLKIAKSKSKADK